MVQILRGCGVGWLVVAPIGPLAWEFPYAAGVALKRKKKSLFKSVKNLGTRQKPNSA